MDKAVKFQKLFNDSRAKLFKVAYNVVQNRELAEDTLQEAYIKAWKKFEDFDQSRNFINWMTTIVRNAAIDIMRNNTRQINAISIDARRQINNGSSGGDSYSNFDIEDKSANLVHGHEKTELSRLLCEAISNLPEDLSKIMLLLAQGFSYTEISDQTNVSQSAVRSRVHRAKQILRKNTKLETFLNF